jgi:hypothetical protein
MQVEVSLMARASKNVQAKWIQSVKRARGRKAEVQYAGSHPAPVKVRLEMAAGASLPATVIRNMAKAIGMSDTKAIGLLVQRSKRRGRRVLMMQAQRCECFNVNGGKECFMCTQTRPFRCWKSLLCMANPWW